MESESTSFWADIKKYEELLVKDPKSYCFAPLSELYRKLGLLDDALGVARRGTEIHPEYVGGHIALGRALFEKGQLAEARQALEKVVKATPENLLAQKLLYRICDEEGDARGAEQSLRMLVAFNPDDLESRKALEELQKPAASEVVAIPPAEEESAIAVFDEETAFPEQTAFAVDEDAPSDEIDVSGMGLEAALSEDDEPAAEEWTDVSEINGATIDEEANQVTTATLADLYASQGFYQKALDIYIRMGQDDPGDARIAEKIAEVKALMAEKQEIPGSLILPDVAAEEPVAPSIVSGPAGSGGLAPSPDAALVTELEQWLQSIRRRKESR